MNESAGTDAEIAALKAACDDANAISARYQENYDRVCRENDRLADALRVIDDRTDDLFIRDVVAAALTDIPDCPHAQQVVPERFLSTAARILRTVYGYEKCPSTIEALERGARAQRTALTASTGEA